VLENVSDDRERDVLPHGRRRERHRLELALHRALDPPGRHSEDPPQTAENLLAAGAVARQLVGRHLERQARAVGDEHAPVAVEDLAAWRLHPDLAHAVVVRLLQVAIAREDLQVPEAEEDHRETDERDEAEHGDPHR
jgi:hypothetical protein